MKNNWIILVLAGLGLWLFTKYQAIKSFQFIPRGVSFDGTNLVVKLGVINGSAFPLSFNSFSGILYVNNSPAGVLTDNIPQTILAGMETDLSLDFAPNPGVLIADVIKFISSGGGSQQIVLQGSISAENLVIPVNQTFTTPTL